jgi:hypothetical protein
MMEGSHHPVQRRAALALAGLAVLAVGLGSAFADEGGDGQIRAGRVEANAATASAPPALTLETFLDRLMIAESDGRDELRNPRSTAVGPFQLIEGTFLEIVQRHFSEETRSLSTMAVLALRTDRAFARRAVEAYTKDNAANLAREGLATSFTNLRLSYLAGPSGAVRLLRAPPQTKVSALLRSAAISANPFMKQMTAYDLIAKCARDLEVDPGSMAGIAANSSPASSSGSPKIDIRCNLKLPSCRRWVALREVRPGGNLARYKRQKAVHSAQK